MKHIPCPPIWSKTELGTQLEFSIYLFLIPHNPHQLQKKKQSPFTAYVSLCKNSSTAKHSSFFPLQMGYFPPDST